MLIKLNSCLLPQRNYTETPSTPWQSMSVCNVTINFSLSARDLGVILDTTLCFEQHISNICRTAYLELCRISSIHHYLTPCLSMQPKFPSALHLSFHTLTIASPFSPDFQRLIGKLQRIQNNSAHLIFQSSRYDQGFTSSWVPQHCRLPISKRIDYTLSSLCHSALTGTGPHYLSDLLHVYYIPSRQLCFSSDDKILWLPTFKTEHSDQRSFSAINDPPPGTGSLTMSDMDSFGA